MNYIVLKTLAELSEMESLPDKKGGRNKRDSKSAKFQQRDKGEEVMNIEQEGTTNVSQKEL
jgi:hypothetical protein